MADENLRSARRNLGADPGDLEALADQQRRAARYATGLVWILEQTGAVPLAAPQYSRPPAPEPEPEPMSASQWEALTRAAEGRGWQGVPPWASTGARTGPRVTEWGDPLHRLEQLQGHHAEPGCLVLCFEDGHVYRRSGGADNRWVPVNPPRRDPADARRRLVRAETEEQARALASRFPDGRLYLSWLNPERSSCSVLGLEGPPEVLA
jgi:hypothetical protein